MNFESLVGHINQVQDFEPQRLREYRQIYIVYPSIGVEVINYVQSNNLCLPSIEDDSIWRLSSAKLQTSENQVNEI